MILQVVLSLLLYLYPIRENAAYSSSSFPVPVLRAWHIDADANVGTFTADQVSYLAYHRQYVLGQPRPRWQGNVVGEVPEGLLAFDTVPRLADDLELR
jgi:hypothetical protein